MEGASGSLIFRNWVDVRTLILTHFKHELSMLGTKTQALFSRDEYQPQSGNVCHKHLAIALDRSTMSDAWAASKIQGLYRMHSAKCSADRRMLERGLSFLAARKVAKMTKDPMKKVMRGFCVRGLFFCVGGEWAGDLESGCIPIPAELAFCMRGLFLLCGREMGRQVSNRGVFRYRLSLLRSRSRVVETK